jgi:phage-related protein
VRFFCTTQGNEPVREWLKALGPPDRKAIGEDIKTVQFGWPLGMPIVRKLAGNLWEVRSHISDGIARTLFTVQDDTMVLVHGFVKKSQKTPATDLEIAKRRVKQLRN